MPSVSVSILRRPGPPQLLGIEPVSKRCRGGAAARHLDPHPQFFGEGFTKQLVAQGTRADLIVGNNVLAHVPKLNDFVRGLKLLLRPHGVITLEFPICYV